MFFEIVVCWKAPNKTCIGFAFIGIKINPVTWNILGCFFFKLAVLSYGTRLSNEILQFKTILYTFSSLKNVLGSGGSLLLTNPAYPISSSYGLK